MRLFLNMVAILLVAQPGAAPLAHGGPCEAEDITATLEAAAEMSSATYQKELTLRGLRLACPGMPTGLAEALEGSEAAPPDMRELLVAKGLSSSLDLLTGVCDDALTSFESIGTSSRAKAMKVLTERCKLGELLTEAEITSVQDDESLSALSVLLARTLHAWLQEAAVEEARTLARRTLGFDLPEPKEDDLPAFETLSPAPIFGPGEQR